MSERGEHGSPVYVEAKGGSWSSYDLKRMRDTNSTEAEWAAMRRRGIAFVEALQARVRAELGLS